MLLATSGGGGLDVADVYKTHTYQGNGSAVHNIDVGIDMTSGDHLVWIKQRATTQGHEWYDTARGATKRLQSNNLNGEDTQSQGLKSFNDDGFTLGANGSINESGRDAVAWIFSGAENFFDIVTYTGNGASSRNISHGLGTTPGMMIIKKRNSSENWIVYHKSNGAGTFLQLNANVGGSSTTNIFASTNPTSSVFTVGSNSQVNENNNTYVAYLFAEDTDNVIKCGTYNGNGGTQTINCGFQPQWVMIKAVASGSNDWVVLDSARSTDYLRPNATNAETTHAGFAFASNGFTLSNGQGITNGSGKGYIYMAIAAS